MQATPGSTASHAPPLPTPDPSVPPRPAARRCRISPTASAPARLRAGHQLVIHAAGEDLQHRIHGFRRGDPQAVHKAALDTALGQIAGHLLAAAVHHHQIDAVGARRGQLRRPGASRDSAASSSVPPSFTRTFTAGPRFPGNPAAGSYSARPGRPRPSPGYRWRSPPRRGRCPGRSATPMSQKLVRATACRSGKWPGW